MSEADGVVDSTVFIWEFSTWQDGKPKKRFAQMGFKGLGGEWMGLVPGWAKIDTYYGIL